MSNFRFVSWRGTEAQAGRSNGPVNSLVNTTSWNNLLQQAIESEQKNLKLQANAYQGRSVLKLR